MMAFKGVRSSWLMVARKRLLASLARSASVRALSSASSSLLRSEMSRVTATTCGPLLARSAPGGSSSARQRVSTHTNLGGRGVASS